MAQKHTTPATSKQDVQKNVHTPIKNWGGLIYTLISAVIIISGTYFAIRWAQGDFRVDESSSLLARETALTTPFIYHPENMTSKSVKMAIAPGISILLLKNHW